MFDFLPLPCKKGNLFRSCFGPLLTAAFDALRLAKKKPYRYHFVKIIPKFSKETQEFLEQFFLDELRLRPNSIFIILRYADGGIALKNPSCPEYILVST